MGRKLEYTIRLTPATIWSAGQGVGFSWDNPKTTPKTRVTAESLDELRAHVLTLVRKFGQSSVVDVALASGVRKPDGFKRFVRENMVVPFDRAMAEEAEAAQ